jgi:c(7)-type cytochrome triheme protein
MIMRLTILLLCLIVAVAFVGIAIASPPGKTVEYAGGEQGKVIFDGSTHSVAQGMKCPDCHPKLFPMKRGEYKMTLEDHASETGCGACHNGTQAFSQSDEADCAKCHKVAGTEEVTIEEEITEEIEEKTEEEPAEAIEVIEEKIE